MSDTLPVGALMGWTAETHPTVDPIFICWHKPNGETVKDGPTPDDMLAWLRERCADLRCFTLEPDGMSVHVRRLAGSGWTFHQGDTLHAALEAAVRAVAEAE